MKKLLHNTKLLNWLLILIITLIWGIAWVYMKASLAYMGPFTFSAFRFGTGAIALLLIVIFMKMQLPPKEKWGHIVVVGILQTTIVFLLVMYGLRFVDAGKSSIILYTMPIWSSFLAVKFLGEKITRNKLVGLLVGMLGLLLIIGWDFFQAQNVDMIIGEAFIVIAAISWGASNVYYRLKLDGLPKLQVSAFQMLFGTIGIIAAAVIMEWGDPVQLQAESIFYILFTGVLASALCFTVWFVLLSKIDMVTATLSTLLVPVFGMFFSWIILDEAITWSIIYGSILIFMGIAITQVSGRKKERGQ
ncbi:Permease of the drug/metabolite transporter (DMT) superfamily [Oceanobacillus limi]|uniref:Permease of the drug/metabolite transporter (DMT) superfamily n=1 Tax=Oceanobacillus limi TaxID=930131 RepID=A0A1I0BJ56_9BACI|nr:DMT family transporter [Oceanobacillus limi]SET07023.1 Permease of the drug/metabolite transporter (DMT) superfamily [Oceanobacillus limi]